MKETLEIDDSFNLVEFKDIAPKYEDDRLSTALLQSTVLLEDAKNFRSIYHKLDKTAIIVYRWYYSKFVQYLLNTTIFVILMLAFFETPSSISLTSDVTYPKNMQKRFQFPCSFLESIDLTCLTIFVLETIVKSYLIGKKEIFNSPWLISYYIVIFISVADCSFSLVEGCQSPFRVRRYLRPFFLIQSSSLMKKALKALKKTIPEIISVLVLLVIHLYFFAIVGMLIFPRYYLIQDQSTNVTDDSIHLQYNYEHKSNNTEKFKRNNIFGSLSDTLINLVILLSTANHPDVMVQAYSKNRLSALYFVVFLIIGFYCIMSLITAVIYSKFKGFFKDSMVSSAFRQSLGIRASFWILHSKFQVPDNPGYLSKTTVQCLIENMAISRKRKDNLLDDLKEITYCIQTSSDISSDIELEQYENLFHTNFNGIEADTEDEEKNTAAHRISIAETQASYFHKFKFRIRRYLAIAFETKIYIFYNCILTLLNIICISAEVEVLKSPYHKIDLIHKNLSYAILAFGVYYTLENIMKIWTFGWKQYKKVTLNVADAIISFIFLLLIIIHTIKYGHPYIIHSEQFYYLHDDHFSIWEGSRLFNVLLIFRLINLAPSIRVMYTLISTAIDIMRKLRPIFGILVFIYYDYALLGMQLFSKKIQENSFDHINTTNPDEYCGSYKQLLYWSHNFDDFYSSVIVLWDIMVINNWQVITEAFVSKTNGFARIYFIIWWVSCTIVTLNMCVSLILDLYSLKCDAEEKLSKKKNKSIGFIQSIHSLFSDSIPKFSDSMLKKAILMHRYFDFNKVIVKIDYEQEMTDRELGIVN